jgi:hypothetical protein
MMQRVEDLFSARLMNPRVDLNSEVKYRIDYAFVEQV